MPKREALLLIQDIIESIEKVFSYTKGMTFDEFQNDSKTTDAVIRNFEIIGEAANQIPEIYKNLHPEIEWHKMISVRNRVIHDYFGVNYEIIWNIIDNHLLELKQQLEIILHKQ